MVVNPNAFRVISGFFVFAFGAFVALPTSNLLFRLSPDSGGAKTLITWSLSGPIRDSYAISIGSWGGIGNYFDGAFNSSYFTSSTAETFAVAGAGSFNNLTTTSSAQLSQILMGTDGSSRFLALSWEENGLGGDMSTNTGNQVCYTLGTDSYVINVPFTAFNPGTYTSSDIRFEGGMNYTTNVVPKPSALSVLAVGFGALACFHRRALPER